MKRVSNHIQLIVTLNIGNFRSLIMKNWNINGFTMLFLFNVVFYTSFLHSLTHIHYLFYYKNIKFILSLCSSNNQVLLSAEVRCFCKYQNGGAGRNGIMCERRGIFEEITSCFGNEFCTGPSSEETAVNGT